MLNRLASALDAIRGSHRVTDQNPEDEYQALARYSHDVEKDPALERRFQPVYVASTSVEDTITILRGIKDRYEVHHGVRITDDSLIAAARLSDRYVGGAFFPTRRLT